MFLTILQQGLPDGQNSGLFLNVISKNTYFCRTFNIVVKKSLILCLLLVSFIFNSCKKNDSNVPDVHVDVVLYLTEPSNLNLNAVGGFIYVYQAGARGLIVYRRTPDEFVALDRNCTYDSQAACATVSVDNTNFFAKDSCCGSTFQINNGQVSQGPATMPLKAYQVDYDGVSQLHIYN